MTALAIPCMAATYTATTTSNSGAGSLRQAILDANASGAPGGIVGAGNAINVTATGTINLLDALPLVFSNLTLNGNGITLDGGNAHRCLFVNGLPTTPTGDPQAITVTLHQLHLNHCRAKGGDGGGGATSGGGGGMGAGGALFVGQNADVILAQVSFDGNQSAGGAGGSGGDNSSYGSGGGGGGLGGDGANGTGVGGTGGSGGGMGGNAGLSSGQAHGGGGGIGGNGGNASSGFPGGGGGGGFGGTGLGQIASNQGFVSAGSSTEGGIGGSNGGGGGGQLPGTAGDASGLGGAGGPTTGDGAGGGAGGASSGVGGIGGGGGSFGDGGFGGGGGNSYSGGFGGGGGGSFGCLGGQGGFGGGGGGGADNSFSCNGGDGGFGGGGGSGGNNGGSPGGFGGGNGSSSSQYGGGGGGALGAAVFVVNGGTLTIAGAGSLASGALSPGNGTGGGGNGSAFGAGIFLQGNGTLTFNLPSLAYTINDDIADANGSGAVGANAGSWGIHAQGGSLVLGGDNTYTGATSIDNGATLDVNGITTSPITISPGGVLGGSGSVANVLNDGTVAPGNATTPLGMLTAQIYDEVAGSTLRIAANVTGASATLNVAGSAALNGKVHFDFSGGPAPGSTYTFFTVSGTIGNTTFSGYDSNMPSLFGEIVYLPHSIQFIVIANDLVFRSGFDNGADVGACPFGAVSRAEFAALPARAIDGQLLCIPPITGADPFGDSFTACQTSTCQSAPGCTATLRAQAGTLAGSLVGGSYSVDTPVQIDSLSAPLTYSGPIVGSGTCTLDISATSGRIVPVYDAEPESLNGIDFGAHIYAMPQDTPNSLTTSLGSCGTLGGLLTAILPVVETQFTATIQSAASGPLQQAGVGQTICPN